MPRYRSPRSRTEEQKMKLKVDLRCIPEWEAELKAMHESRQKSIHNNFRLFSLPEILSAATCIKKMQGEFYSGNYHYRYETLKHNEHLLEQWKNSLTVDNLASSLPPSFLLYRPGIVEITAIIQTALKNAENNLAEFYARGVTDSFWVLMLTSKVGVERVQACEREKAKYLALSLEMPKFEAACRLWDKLYPLSSEYDVRLSQLREQLELAEEKRAAIERFEAKHGKALAKGAAADNKTRKRVISLKVVVKKTKDCPYCGGDLGIEPHLDHIYPVTKGGLSIIENLVWCCSTCNGLKSDKGLMQFLMAQGLPIEQILTRLHSLGKHV